MNETSDYSQERCSECGFIVLADNLVCSMCGASDAELPIPTCALQSTLSETPLTSQTEIDAGRQEILGIHNLSGPSSENNPVANPETASLFQRHDPSPDTHVHTAQDIFTRNADVIGRVLTIEQTHLETPGFNPCRTITYLLWVLLFLFSPLLVLGFGLLVLGPLAIIGAGIFVLFASRITSLTNILFLFHIFSPKGGVHEQVPVRYARVRVFDDDTEVTIRLKGAYSSGNVSPDDIVAFWGVWKNGVMIGKHGFNCRTRSHIEFQRSKWWIVLALTLAFIAGLAMYLHAVWSCLGEQITR